MSDEKIVGKIIKVSREGWGFVSSKNIEFTRIFFHWTALRQDTIPFLQLKVGMVVEFTPVQVPMKGWRAVHIRVLEKPKKVEEVEQKEEEKNEQKDGGEVPILREQ